jgi:dephospho-CoA kinase
MEAYAKLLLPTIQESLSAGPTVIDGMYSWSEYKFLRKRFGDEMKVVAIYTTRSLRYARISQRKERPLTFEEAEQRDHAEMENVEKGGPIAMADYTIVNDGTEKELFRAVDKLLSTMYTA